MAFDQTIYTANGDLTMMNAILNGVAMVCNETELIWGFALLAATWMVLSMTTAAAVAAPAGNGGSELGKRAFLVLIPFGLAMCLTASGLKSSVTVQSGLTGTTTTVDNIPLVISIVPASASLVATRNGEKLGTAMQSTGTDYASISVTGKGFINPLKTLLTSRTAVMRLGGIPSKVNAVLSACLNADSGANYAQIANRVLFAGNLPSAAAGPPSISVWSAVGTTRTSIGTLLAEAAQNTTAIVTDIQVGTNHIATCADAANQVATDIDEALRSPEFARVVQGAVNAADQPNKDAGFTIQDLATQYSAVRTANLTAGGLSGGVAQANAEVINLLFAELVKHGLDCLRADGTNKSTCLAMAVQANEIERNNIQAAANGFESLMYAGAFANHITAIIIGLGPVIVLFMMWAGLGIGRNIKVAVHMIVWPLLIMNVGAELINAMTYIHVANFMRAIAQDGFINQATAVEVYKNFSLEVGTASNMMATLPILMSTIFALGQSAALVKVADKMTSNSKDESRSVNPAPVNMAPLVTNTSVAKAEQGVGGTNVALTGAVPAIAASAQFGNLQKEASNSITSAHQKMHAISSGKTDLASWTDAFSTGNFSKVGVSESTGKALRDEFNRQYGAVAAGKTGTGTQSSKDNFNVSQAGFGLGGEVGAGVKSNIPGVSAGGSVSANTQHSTGANDNLRSQRQVGQEESITQSKALAKSFNQFQQSDKYKNLGVDETRSIQRSLGVQQQYANTLSENRSVSDVFSEAVKRSSGFTALSAKIGGAEVANQMKTNPDYRRYQLNEGRTFSESPASQPYLERARVDMDRGVTDRIVGDSQAQEAMARHRAAFLMATDEQARPEDRLAANEYLLGSTNAMLAARFHTSDMQPREHFKIDSPRNQTGVDSKGLVKKINSETANGTTSKPRGPKGAGLPSTLERDGFAFATEVADGVRDQAERVTGARQQAETTTRSAGLSDAEDKNTRERNRSNAAENFKSTLPSFLRGDDDKPDRFQLPDKK